MVRPLTPLSNKTRVAVNTMTDLSSAAQQVLDAFMDSPVDAGNYYATRSRQIAAALRAAAEQAAPFSTNLRQNQIHQRLVAIATELEAQ